LEENEAAGRLIHFGFFLEQILRMKPYCLATEELFKSSPKLKRFSKIECLGFDGNVEGKFRFRH
jgi:hypothetical protein